MFSVPHQLAKLFILEEEIVAAFETTESQFDLIEEYLQLWQARYNELQPREEDDGVSWENDLLLLSLSVIVTVSLQQEIDINDLKGLKET